MEYEIKELPEGLTPITLYDEPLLEYVIKLAVDMFPDCINILEESNDSIYPSQFLTRYYNVLKKDIKIGNRFRESEDVLETLTAFNIDISKFWYLLLFITDYVNSLYFEPEKISADDLEELLEIMPNITDVTFMVGSQKYSYNRKETLFFIVEAFKKYIPAVLDVLYSEEDKKDLGTLNLTEKYISSLCRLDIDKELNYTRKVYFYNMLFQHFLKDKHGTTFTTIKIVQGRSAETDVSIDKECLISRLLYISGIAGKDFYNDIGKRPLNNLLRHLKVKNGISLIYHN